MHGVCDARSRDWTVCSRLHSHSLMRLARTRRTGTRAAAIRSIRITTAARGSYTMKTCGTTRGVRADSRTRTASVTGSAMAWLALMAVLLVGALASGAQAQGDGSGSDSYIVTFSAGTSDANARDLLASVDATVDSHIAPLRMYSISL